MTQTEEPVVCFCQRKENGLTSVEEEEEDVNEMFGEK